MYFNCHPDPDGRPSLFSNLKMRYVLDLGEDITISGRLLDLLSLVSLRREGSSYVFKIVAPNYEIQVLP